MKNISFEAIEKFAKKTGEDRTVEILSNVLSSSDLKEVVFSNKGLDESKFQFSLEVGTLPVTNQKKSGRCWIFSALNVLRENVAKVCNLEKFELSQNYIAFWDKFEKINYFLNSVIQTSSLPITDRLVTYILDTGIQDGGQWDMLVGLVEKYGVVPKSAMEETFQSSNTAFMNRLINSKLRIYAKKLREEAKNSMENAYALKEEMLYEMYSFLVMCFGEPPKKFDFEYTDKEGVYHIDEDLTPKDFYRLYVGLDLKDSYVSIVNSPTEDKPFYENITIDYLGNVAEFRAVKYLNLPMDEIKELIIKQLSDGEIVWFGSDVSLKGERKKGIWSDECYNFERTLGLNFDFSKEDKLNYRDSAMNHAMVITGVNLDKNGRPNRWKIQNSWGDKSGEKGFYVMNGGWFDSFVYQAVINNKYLNKKQLEALQKEPKHFMPWDPMGTLAD